MQYNILYIVFDADMLEIYIFFNLFIHIYKLQYQIQKCIYQ